MLFSKPYNIACPKCQASHTHRKVLSINDLWSVNFSDGFVSAFDTLSTNKCSQCNYIIMDCLKLENLGEVEYIKIYQPQTFWQKFWRTPPTFTRKPINEYPSLLYLDLVDWVFASKCEGLTRSTKKSCALKAMWRFNQVSFTDRHFDENEKRQLEPTKADIEQIENNLLLDAESDYSDSAQLIAADIYRRRGEFEQSLLCLARVTYEINTSKVVCMRKWINKESTALEVYPSYYDLNGY